MLEPTDPDAAVIACEEAIARALEEYTRVTGMHVYSIRLLFVGGDGQYCVDIEQPREKKR